jgi:hypothetical protein
LAVKIAEDIRKASEASKEKIGSRAFDGATEASAFTLASTSDAGGGRGPWLDANSPKRKLSNASRSTQGSSGLKGITEDAED